MQDHAIYCVWIYFVPTSLYSRREKKHLVRDGVKTRSSCFTSATLTTRPWPLEQICSELKIYSGSRKCSSLIFNLKPQKQKRAFKTCQRSLQEPDPFFLSFFCKKMMIKKENYLNQFHLESRTFSTSKSDI